MNDSLIVRGARQHNLKSVDLDLPRGSMIVFTGLSGSGKSSLAFDTIFAEGQRRYVESLSSYARQFLGQMDKPDVDFIEGLSPAVSIDQKSTSRNPRSTVGTITEIHDYLRLLYARAGVQHCPQCMAEITAQTPQQIVDSVLELPERTRFLVLAPLVRGRKGEYQDLFDEMRQKGFARVRVDGEQLRLDQDIQLDKNLKHTIDVVVDRLVIKDGLRQRLTDSVETALELANGIVVIERIDLNDDDPHRSRRYSEARACPNGHPLMLEEIEPRTFSFNAPYGACPECSGIGSKLEVDPDLLVPDEDVSLKDGAIAVWTANNKYHANLLKALAKQLDFSMTTPWKDLPKKIQKAVLYGNDYEVHVRYKNRWGRQRSYTTGFEGAVNYIERKRSETESENQLERLDSFMREVPCPVCEGARLKPEVLAVTIGDLSIAALSNLSILEARDFLKNVHLQGRAKQIAAPVLTEILVRLNFLVDVGLNYLTLSRSAGTLSGGEAQRIRLAVNRLRQQIADRTDKDQASGAAKLTNHGHRATANFAKHPDANECHQYGDYAVGDSGKQRGIISHTNRGQYRGGIVHNGIYTGKLLDNRYTNTDHKQLEQPRGHNLAEPGLTEIALLIQRFGDLQQLPLNIIFMPGALKHATGFRQAPFHRVPAR